MLSFSNNRNLDRNEKTIALLQTKLCLKTGTKKTGRADLKFLKTVLELFSKQFLITLT